MNSKVVVHAASTQVVAIAHDIADKLRVAMTTSLFSDDAVTIVVDTTTEPPGYRLDLSTTTASGNTIFQLDYQQGKLANRAFAKDAYQLALARALGLRKTKPLNILDATAGFGRDGFMLAALGANVTMLESNPYIAAITSNALQRARNNTLTRAAIARINFVEHNATDFLQDANRMRIFDCVFLDPMFPPTNKSAEVKKEAQFLRLLSHNLAGIMPPDNTNELLQLACQNGVNKVVLKRHQASPVTQSPVPVGIIHGKTIRFEIFQNQKRGQSSMALT